MKKDEMLVLALAGAAVFMILKAGGMSLPGLTKKATTPVRNGPKWEAGGIMVDNNAQWSPTGRAWYDPWTAAVDGGFIPQGL
jgi:hypothetical protein